MLAFQLKPRMCWSHTRWRPSSLPRSRSSSRCVRHEAVLLLLLPLFWWLHQLVWQGVVGSVWACKGGARELPARRWLVLFILCAAHRTCLATCPQGCDCKWKYGKETVECRNAGFIDVPTDLDPGTQVIDMAHNNLQVVPKDTFLSAGLLNLQRIFLQHCSLKQIDQEAFRRLSNLVELDISHNEMTYVPTAAFREVPDLRRLSMNNNPLSKLEDDAFASLPSLTTLELSNCRISQVASHAFRGLARLSFLKLDGNKITVLFLSSVMALRSLHGIHLHNNPWQCDCHLRPTRQWMLKYNVPVTAPPMCSGPPRLLNISWDKLPLEDYACETEVDMSDSDVEMLEDDNVTLSCWITGNPEPTVRWIWQNRIIANLSGASNGKQIFIIHEEGSTEKVNNLTIMSLGVENSGVYSCVAENRANKAMKNITLNVLAKVVEEKGLTVGQLSGIVVGGVLFVVLIILMVSVIVIKCRQKRQRERKRIEIDHHKHMNSINHKDAILALEKHSLAFMGPNPIQKPPRLGHYQGVPTTDLDHYERPLLENSVGPVWVKGESVSFAEEDVKLTTVVEEDEDRGTSEGGAEHADESLDQDRLAEIENNIQNEKQRLKELNTSLQQDENHDQTVSAASCTSVGEFLPEEKEKGQLEYEACEKTWKTEEASAVPSPSKYKSPVPALPSDPNTSSSSSRAPTPVLQRNKVPLLSPPRGEKFCSSMVTVFRNGKDGTEV